MNLFRRCVFALLLPAVACDRRPKPSANDSAAAAQTAIADSSKAASTSSNWDPSAGLVLLVGTETPMRAAVVLPDSASAQTTLAALPHPASVTLYGRGGTVQTAELPAVADSDACLVATLSAAPPPRPWSVGFVGGVVSPLGMDSAQSLAHADSLDVAVGVTRLASAMPNDSAGRFTGLPFAVRAVWKFAIPGGPVVVAAILARQINQEATPLQEHTFLIAERAATDSTWSNAYSERSYGDEETIESRDVLGAVLLGSSRNAAVIVSRDYGNAMSYGLIERSEKGGWRVRWESSRRHC